MGHTSIWFLIEKYLQTEEDQSIDSEEICDVCKHHIEPGEDTYHATTVSCVSLYKTTSSPLVQDEIHHITMSEYMKQEIMNLHVYEPSEDLGREEELPDNLILCRDCSVGVVWVAKAYSSETLVYDKYNNGNTYAYRLDYTSKRFKTTKSANKV